MTTSKSKASVNSTAWIQIGKPQIEKPMKFTNYESAMVQSTQMSRAKSVPRTSKGGPLPNQLTEDEKKTLRERVKKFTEDLKAKVDATYPDNYMASTMIDQELTKEKNQILRRIKFHQKKEQKLKNFIRETREAILADRKAESTYTSIVAGRIRPKKTADKNKE